MICVEWAVDHVSLGLTIIDRLLTKICAINYFFTFSFSMTLTFDLSAVVACGLVDSVDRISFGLHRRESNSRMR